MQCCHGKVDHVFRYEVGEQSIHLACWLSQEYITFKLKYQQSREKVSHEDHYTQEKHRTQGIGNFECVCGRWIYEIRLLGYFPIQGDYHKWYDYSWSKSGPDCLWFPLSKSSIAPGKLFNLCTEGCNNIIPVFRLHWGAIEFFHLFLYDGKLPFIVTFIKELDFFDVFILFRVLDGENAHKNIRGVRKLGWSKSNLVEVRRTLIR